MKADITSKNAYEILGVSRTADVPAIRKAFRALAIQHHPDARPPDEKKGAAEVFARINQAHEILRDFEKRKRYDALLDRGQLPEMSQDLAEQGRFASLGDIVGEVQSMGLSSESDALIATVDEELREKMLKPMLIRGESFKESAADVLWFTFTEKGNGMLEKLNVLERESLGACTRCVLVVTELRLILLATYVNSWQEGNVQHTRTSWRSYAIPYAALQDLVVHEVGRAFKSYKMEIKEQDGTRFEIKIGADGAPVYQASRLSRLLLVANIHKLPLRILSTGSPVEEYFTAAGTSLIPGCLWVVPFVISSICVLCNSEKGRDPKCEEHWPAVARFMNEYFISTAIIYSIPLLCAFMLLDVFARWRLRRPEQVFGDLAVDYASAPPALGEEAPAPKPAEKPVSAPSPTQGAAPRPSKPGPPPLSAPVSGPVAVALPDSIVEAFGDEAEPPLPPPSPPAPQAPSVPTPPPSSPSPSLPPSAAPQLIPCPACGHPNRTTAEGPRQCEECGAALIDDDP